MSKQSRSFTIDEDINRELKARADINASGVVNEFLREYLDTSSDNQAEAMIRQLKREIREIDSDIEDLEAKREAKVNQLQEWQDRRDNIEREREQNALDLVENSPRDTDNAKVQVAAERLDVSPSDVVTMMREKGIGRPQ